MRRASRRPIGPLRRAPALMVVLVGLAAVGCGGAAATGGDPEAESALGPSAAETGQVPVQGYEVVRVHPHDPAAFTQGLTYHAGSLWEGTGRRGESTLRRVAIETGEVLERVDLPASLFGEGIAIARGRAYQLTWTSGVGFVYDLESLERVGQFRQVADGWGLTWTGEHLVQSDGSARLYFLDPESLSPVRTVEVAEDGGPVTQINELEYVDGEIWANVWHSDQVLRIDPREGRVLGRIDLAGLLEPGEVRDPEAVLNGIAHDPETGRIWVTGKLWPRLFEIRVGTAR